MNHISAFGHPWLPPVTSPVTPPVTPSAATPTQSRLPIPSVIAATSSIATNRISPAPPRTIASDHPAAPVAAPHPQPLQMCFFFHVAQSKNKFCDAGDLTSTQQMAGPGARPLSPNVGASTARSDTVVSEAEADEFRGLRSERPMFHKRLDRQQAASTSSLHEALIPIPTTPKPKPKFLPFPHRSPCPAQVTLEAAAEHQKWSTGVEVRRKMFEESFPQCTTQPGGKAVPVAVQVVAPPRRAQASVALARSHQPTGRPAVSGMSREAASLAAAPAMGYLLESPPLKASVPPPMPPASMVASVAAEVVTQTMDLISSPGGSRESSPARRVRLSISPNGKYRARILTEHVSTPLSAIQPAALPAVVALTAAASDDAVALAASSCVGKVINGAVSELIEQERLRIATVALTAPTAVSVQPRAADAAVVTEDGTAASDASSVAIASADRVVPAATPATAVPVLAADLPPSRLQVQLVKEGDRYVAKITPRRTVQVRLYQQDGRFAVKIERWGALRGLPESGLSTTPMEQQQPFALAEGPEELLARLKTVIRCAGSDLAGRERILLREYGEVASQMRALAEREEKHAQGTMAFKQAHAQLISMEADARTPTPSAAVAIVPKLWGLLSYWEESLTRRLQVALVNWADAAGMGDGPSVSPAQPPRSLLERFTPAREPLAASITTPAQRDREDALEAKLQQYKQRLVVAMWSEAHAKSTIKDLGGAHDKLSVQVRQCQAQLSRAQSERLEAVKAAEDRATAAAEQSLRFAGGDGNGTLAAVDAAELERLRSQMDQVKSKRDSLQAVVNMNKTKLDKYAREVEELQSQLRAAKQQPSEAPSEADVDNSAPAEESTATRAHEILASPSRTARDAEREALAQQAVMQQTLQEALMRSAHMKLGSCLVELGTAGPAFAFYAWRQATGHLSSRAELQLLRRENKELSAQLPASIVESKSDEVQKLRWESGSLRKQVEALQGQLSEIKAQASSNPEERLKPVVKIVESTPGVFKVQILATRAPPPTETISSSAEASLQRASERAAFVAPEAYAPEMSTRSVAIYEWAPGQYKVKINPDVVEASTKFSSAVSSAAASAMAPGTATSSAPVELDAASGVAPDPAEAAVTGVKIDEVSPGDFRVRILPVREPTAADVEQLRAENSALAMELRTLRQRALTEARVDEAQDASEDEQIRALRAQLLAVQQQLQTSQKSAEDRVAQERAEQLQRIQRASQKVTQLEARNAELEARNAELEAQAQATADLVNSQAASLAELEQLRGVLAEEQASTARWQEERDGKEGELNSLKRTVLESTHEAPTLSEDALYAQTRDLEEVIALKEHQQVELRAQIEAQSERICGLDEALLAKDVTAEELKARAMRLLARNKELEAAVDAAAAEQLKARIEQLLARVKELELIAANQEGVTEDLRARNERLFARNEALVTIVATKESAIEEVRTRNERLLVRIEQLDAAAADNRAVIAEKGAALLKAAEADRDLSVAKASLSGGMETMRVALEAKVKAAEKDSIGLAEKLSTAESKMVELLETLQQAQSELKTSFAERDALQGDKAATMARVTELEAERDALQGDKAATMARVTELEAELAAAAKTVRASAATSSTSAALVQAQARHDAAVAALTEANESLVIDKEALQQEYAARMQTMEREAVAKQVLTPTLPISRGLIPYPAAPQP